MIVDELNDSGVITVDFGKERRDAARTLAKLLGVLEERDADVLRDPLKYLYMASDRITLYQQTLHAARDSLRTPLSQFMGDPSRADFDTIRIPRCEWERLKACAEIVRACMDTPLPQYDNPTR